ncbi:MAG: FAD-dependent oxidoreductase [Thermoguttaceae bacterium]|nr:FAD-dependent oxidoreductase [Thermoguttaceae bacterium]
MKFVIVGGVAAGASAAARLRRLDESAEIVLLEKGKFISYANCGLPYHVGGVIPERESLLVMPPAKFASWFRVDVRPENEVLRIDRASKTVTVRNADGEYTETYDELLLATGSVPSGIEQDTKNAGSRVLPLWTLSDMDRVMAKLAGAKSVIVVGAGFIGLETAENLRERGLDVTVIQRGNHVLPTLDEEMAHSLADELRNAGVRIRFGCTVKNFVETAECVEVELDCGEKLRTDLVIVSTGVRPNSWLAQEAGLECGPRGHVIVDTHLRTSDPNIFAAGDVVEVIEPIFGGKTAIPLAGPANRQGRIAADNMAGRESVYRGSFGTNVVKVGRLTAASVGLTEKKLRAMGKTFRKLYLHPVSNASYYPGGTRMTLKLLFGDEGTIYGAQIVGSKGVDKRIDSIAQAMRNGLKAPELGELELAYAPPYSSAKDPVNFAGFVAENILTGLSDPVYPDTIPEGAFILDVREPAENELGAIPGAVNIRLGELRDRLGELDRSRLIVTCCQVGLRGYLAERILKQNGFRAMNLSGGWLTWKMFHPDRREEIASPCAGACPISVSAPVSEADSTLSISNSSGAVPVIEETLDVRTLPCPGPVVKLKAKMDALPPETGIHLLAASTFENDLRNWAKSGNHELRNLVQKESWLEADVLKRKNADHAVSPSETALPKTETEHSVAMVLFSNDFDKAMAALILANGLAASGAKVGIFFTFWGLAVLRKNPGPALKKNLISRMFGMMLPKGAEKLALSKMNMLGMGSAMMKAVMKQKGVLSLPELIQSAREAGVRFIACDMAMDVMGITREELIEVDEVAGVATFAELAARSTNTLFI